MASSTHATTSAVLRACASVTCSCLSITLPRGSIKLELLLPRKVFREGALALLGFQKDEVAQDERVHFSPHEAGEGFGGRADDRLAADVEAGVNEHGAARQTLEGREQFVVSRVVLAPDGLHARRVVNVRHRRDGRARDVQLLDAEEFFLALAHLAPHFSAHRRDEEHVGRVAVQFEVFRDALAQDRRRERAETFAELYLQVHLRLHARRARVAENAPCAERARAELHPPLKPADDLLVREQTRDRLGQVRALDAAVARADSQQKLFDLVAREFRAEVRALHSVGATAADFLHVARVAEVLVPDRERRAERAPRVARRGLNPDVLERAFAKYPTIADAVERNAARQTKILLARLAVRVAGHAQHRLFADLLNREIGRAHV